MPSNAEELYKQIEANSEYTQILFRQALQDPSGALQSICELGDSLGLPVTAEEVKQYLSTIDDLETKKWKFRTLQFSARLGVTIREIIRFGL